MKKNVCFFAISIILILFIIAYAKNTEDVNGDYNARERLILEELKLGNLDSFQIYSSDSIDNVEIFQFAFSKNNDTYIGFVAFFHENYKHKFYEEDNIISLNYDIAKDEYPFSLYTFSFNVPTRFRTIENKDFSYQFYYGCINDKKINEIVFEFSNEYVHIVPISGKYYTLGIMSRDDLHCVKGLDKEMNTIYIYSYLAK